jgi:hypothetical protein
MDDARPAGISRRAFGQLIGAAALTGALPHVSHGAVARAVEPEKLLVGGDELCDLTAVDLASRIRRKQVSAR